MKIKVDILKKILELHAQNGATDEIDLSASYPLRPYDKTFITFDANNNSKYNISIEGSEAGKDHDVEILVTTKVTF